MITQKAVWAVLDGLHQADPDLAEFADATTTLNLTRLGEHVLDELEVPLGDEYQEGYVFELVYLWGEQPRIKNQFNH